MSGTNKFYALLALSVGIELVSSSARVTSVKSAQRLVCTDGRTSGPKDRTPGLPGSDKNLYIGINAQNLKKKKRWDIYFRASSLQELLPELKMTSEVAPPEAISGVGSLP